MQLIYEFSRQEIQSHSVSNFQSLFGIDRLKEAAKTNPSFPSTVMSAVKIYFRPGRKGLLHYEDPEIRALCTKLVRDTPAIFLSSTEDRTLKLLFYCTMDDFEVIHKTPTHSFEFRSKGPAAIKHLEYFKSRLAQSADELGVSAEVAEEHSNRLTRLFPCS